MLVPVVLLAALTLPLAAQATDGEALLRRINAEHHGAWFTTLTFVQQSSWPGSNRPDEIWYESMRRPGMLRLDMERGGDLYQTVIFRNDSVYVRAGGIARPGRPLVHPLLVLLHDIHVGDIDQSVAKLRGSGFDLAATHEGRWQGQPVIVVGAAAGDSTSAQFWVDPSRLVVVRVIQPAQGGGGTSDIHVGGFTRQGAALVEGEIVFHTNGVAGMSEVYTRIKAGTELDPSIFDPAHPGLPEWVAKVRGR